MYTWLKVGPRLVSNKLLPGTVTLHQDIAQIFLCHVPGYYPAVLVLLCMLTLHHPITPPSTDRLHVFVFFPGRELPVMPDRLRGWWRHQDHWSRRLDVNKQRPRGSHLNKALLDPKYRTRLCSHWENSKVGTPRLLIALFAYLFETSKRKSA